MSVSTAGGLDAISKSSDVSVQMLGRGKLCRRVLCLKVEDCGVQGFAIQAAGRGVQRAGHVVEVFKFRLGQSPL